MKHPESKWKQYEGKAFATCTSGSGQWPAQKQACELEPPCPQFDRDTLTLWDCYYNDWHGPFDISRLGKPKCGPIVLQPGHTLTLPAAPWARQHNRLVPIVVEQFSDDEATIDQADQMLRSLPHVNRPVSFEVSGFGANTAPETNEPHITIKFIADRDDAPTLYRQLQASYPNSAIVLGNHLTNNDMAISHLLHHNGGYFDTLPLINSHIYPLTTFRGLATDPLAVAIASMEDLPQDGWALLQVLFCPVSNDDWESVSRESLQNPYKPGEFIFNDISERILAEKFSAPLFAVAIRIAADPNSQSVHQQLCGWANQFSNPPQELRVTKQADEPAMANAVGARCVYTPGILLNSSELAAIVHLPGPHVTSQRLRRVTSRTRAATPLTAGEGAVILGTNTHRGQKMTAGISAALRTRHCYIAGKSGTGKSTLLLNMIKQDIEAGHGVGVLDPHGDLIEQVLAVIPRRRINDVAYFNPADSDHPPAFNVMECKDPNERERLAAETIDTIHKFYPESWGVRINQTLLHAIPSILTTAKNGTLADVRRLLVDPDLRDIIVGRLKDPALSSFWTDEYPAYPRDAHLPVLNKLSLFMTNTTLRNVLCQRRGTFDFDHIINDKQIFLANLSKGLLTDKVAGIFGTFIMSKLINATFRRAAIPENDRQPFYLYVDEFQNFVDLAVGFDQILSEARKYRLILTVANQFIGQLSDTVKQAIFGNVGTLLTFQLGDRDARSVANEFGDFTADELLTLELGQAIARVGGSQTSFNLATPPPPKLQDEKHVAAIVAHSRQRFTRPRSQVEKAFAAQPSRTAHPTTPKPKLKPQTQPPKPKEPVEFLRPDGLDDDFVV